MKTVKWMWGITVLFFLLFNSSQSQSKKATVEDIMNNPGSFESEAVEVEGTVDIYVKGTTATTSHYLLKGDYGAILKVTTAMEAPQIQTRVRVTGICYIEPATTTPFISEQNRVLLTKTPVTPLQPPPPIEKKSNVFVIFIILLFAVLVLLIYYQMKMRKPARQAGVSEPEPKPGKTEEPSTVLIRKDLSTVKIYSAPKTMKLLPGELVITSGNDSGKSFKIAGYPTSEGNVVTIGSEDSSGDRAYAHIKLEDPLRTVSRKQARLLERGGKIYIQNLSRINFTQVDGKELMPDEETELRPNASIKMGYLELKYIR